MAFTGGQKLAVSDFFLDKAFFLFIDYDEVDRGYGKRVSGRRSYSDKESEQSYKHMRDVDDDPPRVHGSRRGK